MARSGGGTAVGALDAQPILSNGSLMREWFSPADLRLHQDVRKFGEVKSLMGWESATSTK